MPPHLWIPPPNGQRLWWIAFLCTITAILVIIGWHTFGHTISGPSLGSGSYPNYGVPQPPRAPGEPVPLDEWKPPDVACGPPNVPPITLLSPLGRTPVMYPVERSRRKVLTIWVYFRDTQTGRDYEFVFWDQYLVAVDDDPYGSAAKWMDPGVLKWTGPRHAVLRANPVQSCRWHRMGEPEPT